MIINIKMVMVDGIGKWMEQEIAYKHIDSILTVISVVVDLALGICTLISD